VHNARVRRSAPALAALAALLAMAPPAGAALRFKRCHEFGFRCARVSVPLDRSGRVPGHVSLFVERLRATRRPRTGATFVLAGGPGQSASDSFTGDSLEDLSPAFRHRDLIVFDQRGTGKSGLLRCRGLEKANLLRAGKPAADCAAKLGPARAFYTTSDSVDDIEAVRRALGIPKIALYGTSYGTKVALAYALRYPGNVERLLLDSVVEANGPNPLYLDTFAAVPRALRALCRTGCRKITPDPVADVAQLTQRLALGRIPGRLVDARGRRRLTRFGREDLFIVLVAGDFDPPLRAAFPGAVRSALAGDMAPLVRLKRRALEIDAKPPPPRSLSPALYAAATCEETEFGWNRTASPLERLRQLQAQAGTVPDSAFLPFDRATALDNDLVSLCLRWPQAPQAPPLGSGPLPDVPVLLLEGEADLRTPVENAQRVAAGFPHAKLLVAPDTGHSVLGSDLSGCAAKAFARFFLGGRLPVRCPRGRTQFPPLPIAPTSLRRVEPEGRLRGLRGRTVTALALTLSDVADDTLSSTIVDEGGSDLAHGGGLRGGRYRVNGDNTAILRRMEYVPGVRISGRIRSFGEHRQRGRLRISGHGVPGGVLLVRGNRVRGRLGGHRVRDVLRPSTSLNDTLFAAAASLPGPPGR
jgi:pimeloyl-ACP methyl ester carboxylesterase